MSKTKLLRVDDNGHISQGFIMKAVCFDKDLARRIVACVNACAGLEVEGLEESLESGGVKAIAEGFFQVQSERDEYKRKFYALCEVINDPEGRLSTLERQRDELLAALTHAATDYIDQNGSVPSWWTDKIRQMVKPHA